MTEHDMDLYAPLDDYGAKDPRTCSTCSHLIELCCDYGVCELWLLRHFGDRADPCEVADWCSENLMDMQSDGCGGWSDE